MNTATHRSDTTPTSFLGAPSVFVSPLAWLLLLTLLLLCAWAAPAVQAQTIIYVDQAASGAGDGSSWSDAYTSLQDGLAAASSGDQVWVANGTYYPDEGAGQTDDDPSASFTFGDGVEVYGGFRGDESGGNEASLSERPENFPRPGIAPTILSGDIEQNDADSDGDGVIEDPADISGSNSSHVVALDGQGGLGSEPAVLDGFTVTAGIGDTGPLAPGGGGILAQNAGTKQLRNLRLIGNDGATFGSALQASNSAPSLANVVVAQNAAPDNEPQAIAYLASGSTAYTPVLNNVTVAGNDGGGYYHSALGTASFSATINNSVFHGNGDADVSPVGGGTQVEVFHSILGSCSGGVSCDGESMDVDPQFRTDPADFSLTSGSPALGLGDDALLPADTDDLDADGDTGEPIPFDGAYRARQDGGLDAGAYEGAVKVLPVELATLKARTEGRSVVLQWTTLTETSNDGFHILHQGPHGEAFEEIDGSFVPSKARGGTSQTELSYAFKVKGSLSYGRHVFRLRQTDLDGTSTVSEERAEVTVTPLQAGLAVYPSPFSEQATVEVVATEAQPRVTVELFDALGRRVRLLHEGAVTAGEVTRIPLRADGLSSGTYFIRATSDHFSETETVTLVR